MKNRRQGLVALATMMFAACVEDDTDRVESASVACPGCDEHADGYGDDGDGHEIRPDAGPGEPDAHVCPDEDCVRPLRFWKLHPELWPVDGLQVGLVTYTNDELMDILCMDPSTDGSVRLAQQFIVARLNIEANVPDATVPPDTFAALLDAMDFLGRLADADLRIPFGLAPDAGADLADRIEDFNEGRAGVPLCGDVD